MNWWDILKNQMASTKGKTCQLDFSEPMVEEEEDECRRKLIKFLRKTSAMVSFTPLSNLRFSKWDGEEITEVSDINFGIPYDIEETELFGNAHIGADRSNKRFSPKSHFFFKEEYLTEELACRIIETILKTEEVHQQIMGGYDSRSPYKELSSDFNIDDINPRVICHVNFQEVAEIKGKSHQDPFSTVYIYLDIGTVFHIYFASGSHKTIFDYIRRELS